MKKIIKFFRDIKNGSKAKDLAKKITLKDNPNIVKILSEIDPAQEKARMILLQEEIFQMLSMGEEDLTGGIITKRYKLWQCDFATGTQNEFGMGVSSQSHRMLSEDEFKPLPEGQDDIGNLFPGITFEAPYYLTPAMSRGPLLLNSLGVLILSGKFNPKDQLVLRVVKVKMDFWTSSTMFFKIIRKFDFESFKNEELLPVYRKRAPDVPALVYG